MADLDTFFGIKPKEPTNENKAEPSPTDKDKPAGGAVLSVEKELIAELKQGEVSETINPVTGAAPTSAIAEGTPMQQFEVLFTGRMLLFVTDAVIPRVIIKGGAWVGYKTEKKVEDLQLTDKERTELIPMADAVSKELFKMMPVWQQFLVALTAVYAQKL